MFLAILFAVVSLPYGVAIYFAIRYDTQPNVIRVMVVKISLRISFIITIAVAFHLLGLPSIASELLKQDFRISRDK